MLLCNQFFRNIFAMSGLEHRALHIVGEHATMNYTHLRAHQSKYVNKTIVILAFRKDASVTSEAARR